MAQNNSTQLVFLDSRGVVLRVALGLLALAAIAGAYWAARWQLGRMLVETTQTTDRNAAANIRLALELAPRDPFAQRLAALAGGNGFSTEAGAASLSAYEKSVALSPFDYRSWLELGRARERAGASPEAEAAFRRAVELAPNYAYPRWLLGNFLLRANKRDEAFAEFKRVAAAHSILRQQVFYTLWETIGQNPARIERIAGDEPQVRSALALFYAQKDLPNDAVRVWQSLDNRKKEEFRGEGVATAQGLYVKGRYRAALALFKELGVETTDVGKIQNGGFEADIIKPQETYFGWRVEKPKNVDAVFDTGARSEGRRSLRLAFNGYSDASLQVLTQYVAVEPSARYRLTFAVKTNDLKSAGAPLLEVVDAAKNKTLGATQPFPVGTHDWQTATIEFSTPPDVDAVLVRTVRAFCGDKCPIVGAIWYDDFKLERLGKANNK